ncbi:MAG TPA: hypothetical protein VF719_12525 [Abditibacteriaceae bacterium]|jgi:phage gp29-like protein
MSTSEIYDIAFRCQSSHSATAPHQQLDHVASDIRQTALHEEISPVLRQAIVSLMLHCSDEEFISLQRVLQRVTPSS